MIPFEIVGIVVIIIFLLCLHSYHLTIRRKTKRVKDLLTTVEQNDAYIEQIKANYVAAISLQFKMYFFIAYNYKKLRFEL